VPGDGSSPSSFFFLSIFPLLSLFFFFFLSLFFSSLPHLYSSFFFLFLHCFFSFSPYLFFLFFIRFFLSVFSLFVSFFCCPLPLFCSFPPCIYRQIHGERGLLSKVNKGHKHVIFKLGNWVWMYMQKERFLTHIRSKLQSQGDGPF